MPQSSRVKIPPRKMKNKSDSLLISIAIFTWSFVTDNQLSGIVMGLIIIAFIPLPIRWKVLDQQCQNAADITSLAFVAISLYMFYVYGHQAIYKIIQVIPFIGFPLILIQQASTSNDLPMSTFQYKSRKQTNSSRRINISQHYFLSILFGISVTHENTLCLLFIILLFSGYLLSIKSEDFKPFILSIVGTSGIVVSLFLINSFLPTYNAILTDLSKRFLIQPWRFSNSNVFLTSIGHIISEKRSDKIRIRITTEGPSNGITPIYLTQSVFNEYNLSGIWRANTQKYEALDKIINSTRWKTQAVLNPAQIENSGLTITMTTNRDLFLMPTPFETAAIESKDIVELSRNGYNNLKGEAEPGHVRYTAFQSKINDPSLQSKDLLIPKPYLNLLDSIKGRIGINNTLTDREKIKLIRKFLAENYEYEYPDRALGEKPNTLTNFLLFSKKGHCEHFATATTLLLRAAEIPSRYVVGYLVSEWSELESQLVGRDRHAHAWTQAYLNGSWQTFDFTPPTWELEEAEITKNARKIKDLISYLFYGINTLQSKDFDSFKTMLALLIPPLIVLLSFRLLRSPQIVRTKGMAFQKNSLDSHIHEINNLIRQLETRGIKRSKNETLAMLLEKTSSIGVSNKNIRNLIKSYYLIRFSCDESDEINSGFKDALTNFTEQLNR